MRRTKIDTIIDILVAIRNAGGTIKPTRLLYKANLSYNKLQEFLFELEQKDLIRIEKIDEKKRIHLNDKGYMHISELQKARAIAYNLGLKN